MNKRKDIDLFSHLNIKVKESYKDPNKYNEFLKWTEEAKEKGRADAKAYKEKIDSFVLDEDGINKKIIQIRTKAKYKLIEKQRVYVNQRIGEALKKREQNKISDYHFSIRIEDIAEWVDEKINEDKKGYKSLPV